VQGDGGLHIEQAGPEDTISMNIEVPKEFVRLTEFLEQKRTTEPASPRDRRPKFSPKSWLTNCTTSSIGSRSAGAV